VVRYNELLGKERSTPLPSNIANSDLPQRFCDFFFRKIKSLRDEMDASYCDPPSLYEYGGPLLSEFKRVTNPPGGRNHKEC